jgi:hypothetical protein
MDLNTRVGWSELYWGYLSPNVRASRYILLVNSFPGTAGTYASLKNHSRKSADTLACRLIGTGQLVFNISLSRIKISDGRIDSPDFYESPFWKDSNPASGLGGWGDPNADFSVPDGGFNKLHLSYPSPHTLRRNFTLRPFASPLLPPAFFPDPQKEANASFSASAIEAVLEAGDYKCFQTALETFEVRTWI